MSDHTYLVTEGQAFPVDVRNRYDCGVATPRAGPHCDLSAAPGFQILLTISFLACANTTHLASN